ncbi:hypothetical protein [Craurococcus roseus]|uniref:hypothetical protein n=1 Tax=Craurococcus roseus TaxID=77585 RepID=UPI0031D00EC2
MPRFAILQPPRSSTYRIGFEDFIGISKGLSISSAAASTDDSRGPDFLELGLSQTYNLRIQADQDSLVVSLVSTLNPGEFAPVRLEIIGPNEKVTAELLEHRIHHLRQIYAITLLVNEGREDDLARVLRERPSADLEQDLVGEEDKLLVLDASPGSLIISLIAKSKKAYNSLLYACAVPFAKGRDALLGRVAAGTALAELEVLAKAQDLRLKGAHGVLDLAKKIDTIKDKEVRELIRQRLLTDMTGLTSAVPKSSEPLALDHSPTLDVSITAQKPYRQAEPLEKQKTQAVKSKQGKRR